MQELSNSTRQMVRCASTIQCSSAQLPLRQFNKREIGEHRVEALGVCEGTLVRGHPLPKRDDKPDCQRIPRYFIRRTIYKWGIENILRFHFERLSYWPYVWATFCVNLYNSATKIKLKQPQNFLLYQSDMLRWKVKFPEAMPENYFALTDAEFFLSGERNTFYVEKMLF